VGSDGTTGGVLRYDGATGAFLDVFVPYGSGGLRYPHTLVFGPDGNLYVGSGGATGSVLRYDGVTGAFRDVFVSALASPRALVFGPDGNLYMAPGNGGYVTRYDGTTGAFIDAFVPAGDGSGLTDPTGLVFTPITVTTVEIDVKPGTFSNRINPRSSGKIRVAILTTDTFEATTVDPTMVRFGAAGTEAAPVQSGFEDVDGDGDTDLILYFNTQGTSIVCGGTSATLTGKTVSGQITGSDSVKTVGCK
jgi:hypothetical protein